MTSVENISDEGLEKEVSSTTSDASEIINKTEEVTGNIFTCGNCTEVFQENAGYNEHIKNCLVEPTGNVDRNEQNTEEYPGEISGKRLSSDTGQSLQQGNKIRRPGRPAKYAYASVYAFPCDICNKAFTQKGNLALHIRNIHESPSSYKCGMCPKAFNFKSNLDLHIMGVHTTLRPFKCDSCNFQALRKFDLVAHLRKSQCGTTASNETKNNIIQENLVCPLCQTVCENTLSMVKHIKSHSNKINGVEKDNQETPNEFESGNYRSYKNGQLRRSRVESNTRRRQAKFPERISQENPKVETEKDTIGVDTAGSGEISPGTEKCSHAQECDKTSIEDVLDSRISETECLSRPTTTDDKPITENLLDVRSALARALEVFYQKTKLEENLEKYRCHLCLITCLSDVALAGHMKRH